jgi:endonuclease/exonuclease/phosphatase family metal-dependent hydrolase
MMKNTTTTTNPNNLPTQQQKIDHVFCTPRLFGCVTGVLHSRLFSDHRALIVDFNTAQLLGQTIHIAKPKMTLLT